MEQIQKIREKCIEANPEIKDCCKKHEKKIDGCFSCGMSFRPIRLADILLATGDRNGQMRVDSSGWFEVLDKVSGNFLRLAKWNLAQDDLTLQSLPTREFIYNLLY